MPRLTGHGLTRWASLWRDTGDRPTPSSPVPTMPLMLPMPHKIPMFPMPTMPPVPCKIPLSLLLPMALSSLGPPCPLCTLCYHKFLIPSMPLLLPMSPVPLCPLCPPCATKSRYPLCPLCSSYPLCPMYPMPPMPYKTIMPPVPLRSLVPALGGHQDHLWGTSGSPLNEGPSPEPLLGAPEVSGGLHGAGGVPRAVWGFPHSLLVYPRPSSPLGPAEPTESAWANWSCSMGSCW